MYPKLFEASGVSYKELLNKLIELSKEKICYSSVRNDYNIQTQAQNSYNNNFAREHYSFSCKRFSIFHSNQTSLNKI